MGNLVIGSEPSLVSLKSIFRMPFTGAEWPLRCLIGSLIVIGGYFIPILPWLFLYGYGIRVMRIAIKGEELALPPWDNWGELAWDGLRAFAISLLLLLPGLIVLFGGFGIYFLNIFTLPALGAIAEENASTAGIIFLVFLGSFFIFWVSMGVGNLLLLLGSIPIPAITAHFASTNRFAALFQIGTWSRLIWRNKMGYLIAWVVGFGILSVFYFLFLFSYFLVFPLCLAPIVLPPLLFFILVILQALFGEAYRESIEMLV